MFYSENFYFDGKHSSEFSVYQVTEGGDVINEYGISYQGEGSNEITLSFCYANNLDEALTWDSEKLELFLGWIMVDDYKEFVSEDNMDIAYFLKGVSYIKRFTPDMKGIIDVTFQTLDNYGYKYYFVEILDTTDKFAIFNNSNLSKPYKPVIELKNISSESIQIKNLTTNKEPLIINDIYSNEITVDNTIGAIADSDGNNLIMNCNRKWIELVRGENLFQIEGDCSITLKAYYPVMV